MITRFGMVGLVVMVGVGTMLAADQTSGRGGFAARFFPVFSRFRQPGLQRTSRKPPQPVVVRPVQRHGASVEADRRFDGRRRVFRFGFPIAGGLFYSLPYDAGDFYPPAVVEPAPPFDASEVGAAGYASACPQGPIIAFPMMAGGMMGGGMMFGPPLAGGMMAGPMMGMAPTCSPDERSDIRDQR